MGYHRKLPYELLDHWLELTVEASLYFCDGGRDEGQIIDASEEPWLPLTKFILKENPNVQYQDVAGIWKWTAEREKYRAEYNKCHSTAPQKLIR